MEITVVVNITFQRNERIITASRSSYWTLREGLTEEIIGNLVEKAVLAAADEPRVRAHFRRSDAAHVVWMIFLGKPIAEGAYRP